MSKPTLKERLKQLLAEYGKIALIVYFAIFALVYLGFLASISAGVGETDTAGTVGTAGAAWLATKVTQPLRIGATFLITPLVARLIRREAIDLKIADAAGTENENGAADGDADSVDEKV